MRFSSSSDDLARSFAALAGNRPHSLILGSMPGRQSLHEQRYYAHPRNAFWPIMRSFLGVSTDADYSGACATLVAAGFALWDVLAECERPGSLDSKIRTSSVEANDFASFYSRHDSIRRVFFNGMAAQTLYRRHVLPDLPERFARLPACRLPSTSPAHASLSQAEKMRRWHDALSPECAKLALLRDKAQNSVR